MYFKIVRYTILLLLYIWHFLYFQLVSYENEIKWFSFQFCFLRKTPLSSSNSCLHKHFNLPSSCLFFSEIKGIFSSNFFYPDGVPPKIISFLIILVPYYFASLAILFYFFSLANDLVEFWRIFTLLFFYEVRFSVYCPTFLW